MNTISMRNIFKTLAASCLALAAGCAATKSDVRADDFAVGADISSVTKLESRGYTFAGFGGNTGDVFRVMKDMGVNAVRLRVWVDPKEGWCNQADTAAKAKRAADAGLDIMIDFHYSDDWADPGKQIVPKAWSGKSPDEVERLLVKHTYDVLSAIKSAGAEVKWVQIGNEVAGGMLWTPQYDAEGKAHWEEVRPGEWSAIMVESYANNVRNPDNWASYVKSATAAVKSVFPSAKTIIHLPNAHDTKAISDNLNILKSRGVTWDLIGVSLYTQHARDKSILEDAEKIKAFDQEHIRKSARSIRALADEFKTPVMIVETGFEVTPPAGLTVDYSATLMRGVMKAARGYLTDVCPGVFYWEPTSLEHEYPLGAYKVDGKVFRPTSIMTALTSRK